MRPYSIERSRLIAGLLDSVERDGMQSQRRRASEFGVAVGLVNAYLKFCISKGYVRVKRFPARRYSYLLTPKGFAEKSRLTITLLSNSLSFFRQARTDCASVFESIAARGWQRVLLLGASEIAEISTICALETGITISGIVDSAIDSDHFLGFPLFASFAAADTDFDGVIVTDIKSASRTYAAAVALYGEGRVVAPSLLAIKPPPRTEPAQ